MDYLMLLVVVLNLYANNIYPTMRCLSSRITMYGKGTYCRFENFVVKYMYDKVLNYCLA